MASSGRSPTALRSVANIDNRQYGLVNPEMVMNIYGKVDPRCAEQLKLPPPFR
jgi:hypothetical protein